MSDDHFVGAHTLQVIAKSSSFNHWLYLQLKNHIKGEVLEIGSGIGNISQYIIADNFSTTLSDIDPKYISVLKNKFKQYPNFIAAEFIDLMQAPAHTSCYDTIIAVNVIEHIADDDRALKHIYHLLKPGGTFIVLVPAYPILFCKFDYLLKHFRRYTNNSLSNKLTNNGFMVVHARYFNLMGIIGWVLFGKILQRSMIEEKEMGWFDKLVPLAKIADRIVANRVGLSVICIGQKK